MRVPELPDEIMDKLAAWHEEVSAEHNCVVHEEGQACCVDSLIIAHPARKNTSIEEISTVTELAHEYIGKFLKVEGMGRTK